MTKFNIRQPHTGWRLLIKIPGTEGATYKGDQLYVPLFPRKFRDRAEGGAGGALAPPLFCKNKNKLNKK